jgi:hypothetical protein
MKVISANLHLINDILTKGGRTMFGTREKGIQAEITKAKNQSAKRRGPSGCIVCVKAAQPVRS